MIASKLENKSIGIKKYIYGILNDLIELKSIYKDPNIPDRNKKYIFNNLKCDNKDLITYLTHPNNILIFVDKFLNNEFEDMTQKWHIRQIINTAIFRSKEDLTNKKVYLTNFEGHSKLFTSPELLDTLHKTQIYKFKSTFIKSVISNLDARYEKNTFVNPVLISLYLSYVHEGKTAGDICKILGVKEITVYKKLNILKNTNYIIDMNDLSGKYYLNIICLNNIINKGAKNEI